MNPDRAEAVLNYWFGPLPQDDFYPDGRDRMWFAGGEEVDADIRRHFFEDFRRAKEGQLDAWKETPRGCLALIILLDQFPRNLFRDLAEAFAQDAKALAAAKEGIGRGFDLKLRPVERLFFYLPFEHSEDREDQKRSVELFTRLEESAPAPLAIPMASALDYAEQHRAIIERFGRFPHRNASLGRVSTPEEQAFLKQPGSSF